MLTNIQAITDAHEDFKKEQTLRRENRKRRSVSVRRRQTVSGDYRTERSRWPDLQRLGFGDSKGNEGIPQVSKTQDGVAWGETVKLGTHPGLCDTDVNTIFATFQMDQDRYIVVDSETLRKPLLGERDLCAQLS